MQATISIITPNFNNEEFIKDTAESVIKQTYPNWEWIVVDDGSTDNSFAIINEYASKDKHIKVYKRNRLPKGPSTCRNIGIEKAKGDYIIFLDGDDFLENFCLKQRIEVFNKSPEMDFIIFNMTMFSNNPLYSEKIVNKKLKENDSYLGMFIRNDFPWQTTCPIWKANFLKKVNGFDENLLRNTDPDLHVRALFIPNIKFLIQEDIKPDCFYRIETVHKNEIWKFNVIKGRIIFQKKILELIQNSNYNSNFKNEMISNLKKGILELFKNWLIVRVKKHKEIFDKHLYWAKQNALISKRNYYLLLLLKKFWIQERFLLNNIFKLKGLLHRMIK